MRNRLYRIYHNMKNRCYNTKSHNYINYGFRGITICDEWNNTERTYGVHGCPSKGWLAFKKWSLENGYQDDLSIDRIDNNKGYSPDNCQWVSRKTQNNNQRSNHRITYKGKTQTLSQWCEELGLDYDKTKARLHRNWTTEDAFEIKGNHSLKLITYKGKTQSLSDWCRELGLKYYTVVSRLNDSHWTIEKAFETKGNGCYRMITYKGRTQNLSAWCRELGLNYALTRDRLNKCHWTVERAFDGTPCGVKEDE